MDGMNLNFLTDPYDFLRRHSINIFWFDDFKQRALAGQAPLDQADALLRLPILKYGFFDLQLVANQQSVDFCVLVRNPTEDRHLGGYWCPYESGTANVGFVDVPRREPHFPFVFTPGMYGCALDLTDSPRGPQYFRVYHNQHPGDPSVEAFIARLSPNRIRRFDFEDYGYTPSIPAHPAAFNFLYFDGSRWHFISQATYKLIIPGVSVVQRDPTRPTVSHVFSL